MQIHKNIELQIRLTFARALQIKAIAGLLAAAEPYLPIVLQALGL